jgi:methionyl-tRNA formyltransferase
MEIGILTYNVAHKKTQDIFFSLLEKGEHSLTILTMPFKERKKRNITIQHRPNMFIGQSPEELSQKYNVPVLQFTHENIKKIDKLDYVLIGGAGIIPDQLIISKKIINCHCGLTPLVRGLDSLKWCVIKKNPIGNTLHFIDETVDNGPIIFQRKVKVYMNDKFGNIAQRMYEDEIDLITNFDYYLKNMNSIELDEADPTMRMPSIIEKTLTKELKVYLDQFSE